MKIDMPYTPHIQSDSTSITIPLTTGAREEVHLTVDGTISFRHKDGSYTTTTKRAEKAVKLLVEIESLPEFCKWIVFFLINSMKGAR
jgi:hypothetical protein